MTNEDNPYGNFLEIIRKEAHVDGDAPFFIGTVVQPNPLIVKIGDLQIEQENMKVNQALLAGYSRRMSMGTAGATNKGRWHQQHWDFRRDVYHTGRIESRRAGSAAEKRRRSAIYTAVQGCLRRRIDMSTSLFPFFGDTVTTETEEELPLYREVAWDFKNNIPIVEKGDFKIVTGNEAIKTWIYKTLKTERFRYEIYSWDYGCEIEELIGQNYTPNLAKAECVRYIKEALTINPYIKNIAGVEVTFATGKLMIYAKLETVYGEMEVSADV